MSAVNNFSPLYQNCRLCHRRCGIDRTVFTGYCGMPDTLLAARAALHYWEEPCISGQSGSGAVFFSGCSLRCVYCQNHDIALGLAGKKTDTARLSEIFLELQEKGAVNINLITPTHYVPSILPALDAARRQGLKLPVVYNTGNYETLDTLKMLEGYIDIYLPDFKYWNSELGRRYSNAPDYAIHACENIAEMFRQVGKPIFLNEENHPNPAKAPADPAAQNSTAPSSLNPPVGRNASETSGNLTGSMDFPAVSADLDESEALLMKRGIIVRHLTLPGALSDSKQIIRYLYKTYGNSIYLSIMNQFTPLYENLTAFPELSRKITEEEYDELIDYAIGLGVENAFIQEGETAKESFIPAFDNEGI